MDAPETPTAAAVTFSDPDFADSPFHASAKNIPLFLRKISRQKPQETNLSTREKEMGGRERTYR